MEVNNFLPMGRWGEKEVLRKEKKENEILKVQEAVNTQHEINKSLHIYNQIQRLYYAPKDVDNSDAIAYFNNNSKFVCFVGRIKG